YGIFGDIGGGNRIDQLGAILGDPARLVSLSDHEAGDVLQKEQGNFLLAAQFDEMRTFQRALAEQDAVIRQNTDWMSPDMGAAAHQGRAVQGLEFLEFGTVDDAGDDLAYVVGLAGIDGNDAVEFAGRVEGIAWRNDASPGLVRRSEPRNDAPGDADCMCIIGGQMVCNAGEAD